MKLMDKISLRMRITLLTGVLILVVAFLLTYASMYNAGNRFNTLTTQMVEIVDLHEMQSLREAQGLPGTSAEVTTFPAIKATVLTNSALTALSPGAVNGGISDALTFTPATLTIAAQKQFRDWGYVAMAVIAAAGMAAAWFIAGRALAPVRRLSAATAAVGENDLTTRIAVSGPRDEIGELTRSFNGMMDRLEESFERQKRFSSNVAHELKTPLSTMKMSLQVARMEMPEDIYSVTERSVDRLIRVVDDLLTLTSEGELKQEDSIDPEEMLREIASELEPLYEEKKLTVSYNFPAEPVFITGERGLVRRMFANLFENAMKYNVQEGSIQLLIEERTAAEGAEAEGRELAITIADSGPGISGENLKKIFDPFFCVDPSRSRKLGGAGLGLSIAMETARRHGWLLTAESVPGEGSKFTVIVSEYAEKRGGEGSNEDRTEVNEG